MYRYKASFGAVYAEGLKSNNDEILHICDIACRHSKLNRLSACYMKKLIKGVEEYDQKSEFEFLARLSFANWIYGILQ
jgi:hypothetical protein